MFVVLALQTKVGIFGQILVLKDIEMMDPLVDH